LIVKLHLNQVSQNRSNKIAFKKVIYEQSKNIQIVVLYIFA